MACSGMVNEVVILEISGGGKILNNVDEYVIYGLKM